MMKHLPECFFVLSIFPSLLPTGGEDVPVILNGLINQSIPMSLSGGPSGPVHLVIWNFKTKPFVTYTNNQLNVIEENFKGRLEILDDGRVLKIGYLRLEDSGLYTGTITVTNNTNYKKVYNLTVYGGEEVPDTLNGLINQSILMSLANYSPPSIQQVIWNFGRNPLATYSNNQIIYIEDSFEGRLEILNDGRSLKIGNLRLEDSALYTATITFTDKTKDRKTYNLTVYEPVPTPSIKIAEKKTDDWCNATLYCSAPKNKSSLSYTWNYKMYRNSTYQQYNSSGDTIEITLQKGSWDMEFMCIVQNPADRKNVSVQNICLYNDRRQENAPNDLTCWTKLYIYLPILTVLSLSLPLLCLLNKRKPE
ncbi:SLAM family member 9-like [Aquarana catesbeiana]|uniref:SLAM family member 9-like n=1 Tax=Aquarana catesbeiana TaxID=8400 RepID=UPI003CC97460